MSTAALKIKVTIAQPFVVAGSPFSLTTTVENLHEEAIDILEFLYHIPYQVQWIHDKNYDQWSELISIQQEQLRLLSQLIENLKRDQ